MVRPLAIRESLTLLFMYEYIQVIFGKMIGTSVRSRAKMEKGGHDVHVDCFFFDLVVVVVVKGRVTTHS